MMKAVVFFAMLGLSMAAVEQRNTITQVVGLLQDMLDKSVKEGDEEREIYAKFKCFCDQSEALKTTSISELTEQIELLKSSIAETQGATGTLSSECAELKTNMADNKAAREEADTLRNKENKAFNAEESDLKQAIGQMRDAIETLSKVGADQTKSTGADNKQFMAGHKGASLLGLESEVQTALRSATALMSAEQQSHTESFLQAPFTGTYTSQSAQVMGIIKSMRDTFKANLADARKTEKNSKEAYDEFIKIKKAAHQEMKDSYEEKQKDLGGNDGSLEADKKSLSKAEKQSKNDSDFLAKLIPMCEEKAAGFATRKLLRASEESAIAEAISILNSDDAFATFGTTSATSTGAAKASFLQLRSSRRHVIGSVRRSAQDVLRSAAKDAQSTRLSKVVALLQAENPFDTVLGEIATMLDVIKEEQKADETKKAWCEKERRDNKADLKRKNGEISSLDTSIGKLKKQINDPIKGLKAMIEKTEASLVQNTEQQTKETKFRTEENVAYQQDVRNLVQAQSILTKALKALTTYYNDLEAKIASGDAFLQEDPKAPEAWKGDGDKGDAFAGQSSKGGDVIDMLKFILDETNKEELKAHSDEEKAQADYEDSMTDAKKREAKDEKSLAGFQETLAEKEKDLLEAEEDHKNSVADKDAIEAYLVQITPGCDFIKNNFDQRTKNRNTEKGALKKAIGLIKGTPAYTRAVNEATVESYGDCHSCEKDDIHVKCLACQADVTIPAYCAGHKKAKGC